MLTNIPEVRHSYGTGTNKLIFNSPDTIYFINVVDINYFVNGKLMLTNKPEVRQPYGTGTGSGTGTNKLIFNSPDTIYCTILFNSSGHVTRDAPDENLVSATSQTCCDMSEISDNFRQFCAAGDENLLY
jgi:hypothetical protein